MKERLNQEKETTTTTQQMIDEVSIRKLIDEHIMALRVMNLDDVMTIYAKDIVSFDITPPLKYVGLESKRKPWIEAFAMLASPVDYEVRDLKIVVDNNVAFSHSLNRMNAKLKTGQKVDFWLRWTACFRKIEGNWLIVHEQVSVPADFETGKAFFNLHP